MRQNQMNQDSYNQNTPQQANEKQEFDLERELLKFKYNDKQREQ